MPNLVKTTVRSTLRRLGYTVHKAEKTKPSPADSYPSFIYGFLSGLLAKQGKLGIIQCGANDGVTVDPLATFIRENISSVKAILIEPLPDVAEVLSARYAEYQNVVTLNTAIGPDGTIDLFRIKPQYSAKYRGIMASGITSFNKDYVLKKAEHLRDLGGVPLEERIERFTIETTSITAVIDSNIEALGVDPFIQIDTEGFDDQVIYTLDFELYRPVAISYEFCHLEGEKLKRLHSHLRAMGYSILQWSKDDEIAILRMS